MVSLKRTLVGLILLARSLISWEEEEKEIAFVVETIMERCPMPDG